jgi:cell fate (sporulation/competence/biofilm development) regulator YlbF (YheA/YmcA/DUF963 family)
VKKNIVLFIFLFSASSIFAQITPTPVINNEIRDGGSERRRKLELERIKRDADRVSIKDAGELTAKFAEIKEEFETIQKLQTSIIKAYTTGKTIDYAKISQSSAEMSKKAYKLNENLFNLPPTKTEEKKDEKPKSVRDLIIELDNAIGNFVKSPIFKNANLVAQKDAEKSQEQLERIIKLSAKLSLTAKNKL